MYMYTEMFNLVTINFNLLTPSLNLTPVIVKGNQLPHISVQIHFIQVIVWLQCFDAVGWAAGRASACKN